METIQELKELFTINNDINIEEQFRNIAHKLFFEYAIFTSEYGCFLFKEIEFYYYCSKHKDIITHPRNSEPLLWYINDFGGIDINFASHIQQVEKFPTSKYILDDSAYFGGVLIRQLISTDKKKLLGSPLKVAELYRKFDASEYDSHYPIIKPFSSEGELLNPENRINLVKKDDADLISQKVRNILFNYDKEKSKIPEDLNFAFQKFIYSKYRYIRN
ncbi:MAG: hypothetical protein MJZ79_05330 [Paludibacteraceae bacterium]|nr:hypothetical protein [Paludibacteraceae bacterium]